jgi:hypothetical protein
VIGVHLRNTTDISATPGATPATATSGEVAQIAQAIEFPHVAGNLGARAGALLEQQRDAWPLLRDNLDLLAHVRTREIRIGRFAMRAQFNPARITSSTAKVDAASIQQRPCFLCPDHLPPQQRGLVFRGDYLVLANPFPIFPEHFTVPHRVHRPQRILNGDAGETFDALLELAEAMEGRYTVFYNGPKCGASAPDHLHFQAGTRKFMPIETEYDDLKGDPLAEARGVTAYAASCIRPFIGLESAERGALSHAFAALYRTFKDLVDPPSPDDEPMMNVLAWFDQSRWRVIVLPRVRHRPSFYFADGDEKLLLSPGSVDLGGVCILPVEHDFDRLAEGHVTQMLREVMLPPDLFRQLAERFRQLLS